MYDRSAGNSHTEGAHGIDRPSRLAGSLHLQGRSRADCHRRARGTGAAPCCRRGHCGGVSTDASNRRGPGRGHGSCDPFHSGGTLVSDPRRGDIWWGEAPDQKGRPYLVLTRDEAIPVLRTVLAAPVTRTVRGIPTEVSLGPP